MLVIGFGFVWAASQVVPIPLDVLFVSYAPGGVTEMSLIALSLQVSPVIVAAHHLFRIIVTVIILGITNRGKC